MTVPKHKFRVEIKGKEVWSGEFSNASAHNFPAEYLARPATGAVHLIVDDETIGIQVPLPKEA
jgi:hypothetical protein